MLAQLLAGAGVAQAGVRVQEEREFGPLDQSLFAGRPTHQPLQGRDRVGRQMGMIGRVRWGHGTPPSSIAYTPSLLYTNFGNGPLRSESSRYRR
jgi:hypothetical protein